VEVVEQNIMEMQLILDLVDQVVVVLVDLAIIKMQLLV
tara:strand:+ start:6 stop:119 length:114 start_codon:yes stop_codon:yes gene_type:complete